VPDKARIRWLCRRGMKELDVLLERYLAQHFDTASPAQRLAFVQLLDREDPELWAWLVGQAPAPADYADVVERIQQYA
jgi:antitoxin CptB